MDWFIFEILGWLVLVAFLGLTIYDIVRGVPTRWYSVKKGINGIVKVILVLGVLLGFVVLIAATPSVLNFFAGELNFPMPYGWGYLSDFASYYWVFFIILLVVYLTIKSSYVDLFKLTNKEYEWERAHKERERREIASGRAKIKVWFEGIFKKEKHA